MDMSATMAPPIWFSDLSRDSKAVAAAADNGPVTIKRRDGDDLLLLRKAEVEQERAGVDLISLVVAAAVSQNISDEYVFQLVRAFPWANALPESEQREFAAEVLTTAQAAAALSSFGKLATVVSAWKSTAWAYANGYPRENLDFIIDHTPVIRP